MGARGIASVVLVAMAVANRATAGFVRDKKSVAGTPPKGCDRWEDECNHCLYKLDALKGCTDNDTPCPGLEEPKCTQMENRACAAGQDCEVAQDTCSGVLVQAGPGALQPQCDANNPKDWSPVQCSSDTSECWCVYTDTGEKIPNVVHGGGTLGPEDCSLAVRAKVGEPCLIGGQYCASGFLSTKCPTCEDNVACIVNVDRPDNHQSIVDDTASGGLVEALRGVCSKNKPALSLSPEDQAQLEDWVKSKQSVSTPAVETMIQTCDSRTLDVLCNYLLIGGPPLAEDLGSNPDLSKIRPSVPFCGSVCQTWSQAIVDGGYCSDTMITSNLDYMLATCQF